MEMLNKIILIGHIGAGFVAIALFWVQAATHKGGARHRKVGNLYVKLMWVVVSSAVLLCVINFINGRTVVATFLIFIALITAKPLWLGIAVLKARKDHRGVQLRAYRVASVVFNLVIVLNGGAMVAYGIYLDGQGFAVLLMIFGSLGLLNMIDLWWSLKAVNSTNPDEWIKAHIVGMGTSAIAAHTAFLVFGANRFLPEAITQTYWSFVPWLAPTFVGTILIRIAVKKYQAKPVSKPV